MPYLPAPGSDVVGPSDPLTYILSRIRMAAVEEELFDEMHVLEHLSEGYARACERAWAMQEITTIDLAGTQEHPLPSDCYRVLSVYLRGFELDPLPSRHALREGVFGYYVHGDTIGFRPLPSAGETAWLHYVQTPTSFAEYTDAVDAAFGPEFYYALVHYARWKARAVAGGSQGIPQAQWERDQYELAVMLLRRRSARTAFVGPSRFVHVLDTRRPRRGRVFAPDVDAR